MRIRLRLESRLALLIGSVFGLAAVVFVPPAATFDGPSHYFRSLQVSGGRMRAEAFSDSAVGGVLPKSDVLFVNSLWNSYWALHDFGTLRQWSARSTASLAAAGDARVEFTNTAIYSPVNYAPQALGIWISRLGTRSPLAASRAACVANLAAYLAVMVAALEVLPRFHRGALILASCPLTIIQAASVSVDAINFALPFLLLACVWRLREHDGRAPSLGLAGVLALGLAIALLKPTAVAALACIWLIPGRHFGTTLRKFASLCAYCACAAAVWLAWNRANLGIDVARWFEPLRAHASAQKEWFLADPRRFIHPFGHFLAFDMARQWPHMYADVGGWIPAGLYETVSWGSLAFLGALVACGSWPERADRLWAAGMLVQTFALLVLVSLALWTSFGTADMDYIPGLTGRYLPLMVAGAAIAWAELFHSGAPGPRSVVVWTAVAANCAGLTAIVASIASRTA